MNGKNQKWRWHSDVYTATVMLLIGLFLGWEALSMPSIPRRFPLLACILICILSLAILVRGIVRTNAAKSTGETFEPVYPWSKVKYALLMMALLISYAVLINVIGFFPATALFVPVCMVVLGVRKPLVIILSTVGINLFIWFLFIKQLHIPLP